MASIQVGRRYRRDLGDLDDLIESIRTIGLLQPITISPDGLLICGARRLAAVKQLGIRRINVWVRSGISTPLQQLLAEQHDNTVRKALTPIEAADIYQELKMLLAQDAAQRRHATQFGSERGLDAGSADSAEPSDRESRTQAARLVSGSKSYTRYEQVLELRRATEDHDLGAPVRQAAMDALKHIDTHGKVNGAYSRFKTARAAHADTVKDLEPIEARKRRHGLRSFLVELTSLHDWTTGHHPAEIGPELDDKQWAALQAIAETTNQFVTAAQEARRA